MIPKGLFAQIGLLLLAVGIIFTYIRPTFEEIGQTQDEILTYQTEIEKVTMVNQKLMSMVATIDSTTIDDRQRLLAYMPNTVDILLVPRDIQTIVERTGGILDSVSYDGVRNDESSQDNSGTTNAYTNTNQQAAGGQFANTSSVSTVSEKPTAHAFSVSFAGNYQQVKNFLSALETNHYPLEVHQLTLSPAEGGFLNAELELVTYSHLDPSPQEELQQTFNNQPMNI